MKIEMLFFFLCLLAVLAGFILCVYGSSKVRKMIFPEYRKEIPIFAEEVPVEFEKSGKYEILFSYPFKFRSFRRIPKGKDIEIKICESFSKEDVRFTPYKISLWSRSDLRGRKSFPLGYVEIKKPGVYLITNSSISHYEEADYLSIMSYSGGAVQTFMAVWSILLGLFLFVGASISSWILWTTEFHF